MKCWEAQELFGLMWDLPVDDPRRLMLEQHLSTCSDCKAEFQLWEESYHLIQILNDEEVTDTQLDVMNRNVMERIYSESPWLIQDHSKPFAVSGMTRRHLSLWIAGCLMLFLISFLFFMTMGNSSSEEKPAANGILPTGIAGSSTMQLPNKLNIPDLNSGIIEPLVVTMGPSHPQYWMVLSILSIALALFSLRRLSRIRR
ncbi:hypothetical protein J2T13_004450 [Paenibacillus sp. DS2015]|uniref:anti-sigma factor family protein n=1 Tax=Paenibacillus sp. DS2015 TaxID=3373917 RepID=UPI003D2039E9